MRRSHCRHDFPPSISLSPPGQHCIRDPVGEGGMNSQQTPTSSLRSTSTYSHPFWEWVSFIFWESKECSGSSWIADKGILSWLIFFFTLRREYGGVDLSLSPHDVWGPVPWLIRVGRWPAPTFQFLFTSPCPPQRQLANYNFDFKSWPVDFHWKEPSSR